MKILIISSTVSQNISVGKIATELCDGLKKRGNRVKILYLDNSEINSEDCIRLRSKKIYSCYFKMTVRSKFAYRGSPFTIHRIKKYIREFKPDIVHLIQPAAYLIDNIALFRLLGRTKLPCVYAMIDENPYLGHCDNAYECTQFIEGCHLCHGENYERNRIDYGGRWTAIGCRRLAKQKMIAMNAVKNICFLAPEWVISRAQQSKILRGRRFSIVDEYVNNNTIFIPHENDIEINARFGLNTDKIIILNVARYSSERKGVRFFFELACRLEAREEYLFVNVGYDGAVDKLPRNYLAIPFVSDQLLLSYFYSIADLYMITSLSDTMPNVCLEALSCGTPICGFNNTGIPFVAQPPLGRFVSTGDVEALADIVKETQKKTESMRNDCRKYALERYSANVNCTKILKLYNDMLN